MNTFQYIVTKEDEGVPVKGLLRHKFNFSSRFRTKIKYQNLATLNGQPVEGWIIPNVGDVLEVKTPEEKSEFPAEDIPISLCFEDEHLLIINKQPGVTVHPTKGHPLHTIANGLMKYMEDTNQSFKIRFVNRLDMDTSGLLIIGKNSHTQDALMKQMKSKGVEKRYLALVNGLVEEDEFTVDLPIGRPDMDHVQRAVMLEGGQESITHVKVVERFPSKKDSSKGYTLVELLLGTGRTHQIRVHMTHLGHPLVGDYLYGGDNPWLIERQALHAYKLTFYHPVTNEHLTVEAPLPEDIQKAIERIKN